MDDILTAIGGHAHVQGNNDALHYREPNDDAIIYQIKVSRSICGSYFS